LQKGDRWARTAPERGKRLLDEFLSSAMIGGGLPSSSTIPVKAKRRDQSGKKKKRISA